MRALLATLVFMLSLSAFASTPAENLLSELKSSSWTGSFHFEVFRKTLGGNKKTMRTSATYPIDVQFTDSLTEDGQVAYYFTKDVTSATGKDEFVFNNIDVQACEGEPRLIEVTKQRDNGSYAGIVNAPECKKGKRTTKQLHIESITRDGDDLNIVISDKALGDYVTFKVFYTFKKISE